MCRELNREPAWVAAIRLALTQGWADVESVVEEANLVAGRERTVRDVLDTMADRDVLRRGPRFDETGRYLAGPVLHRSAPSPSGVKMLSKNGVHQWARTDDD
ncbi:MAG: hypothetical protein ABEJ28_08835 [Salinigranum sp.]